MVVLSFRAGYAERVVFIKGNLFYLCQNSNHQALQEKMRLRLDTGQIFDNILFRLEVIF